MMHPRLSLQSIAPLMTLIFLYIAVLNSCIGDIAIFKDEHGSEIPLSQNGLITTIQIRGADLYQIKQAQPTMLASVSWIGPEGKSKSFEALPRPVYRMFSNENETRDEVDIDLTLPPREGRYKILLTTSFGEVHREITVQRTLLGRLLPIVPDNILPLFRYWRTSVGTIMLLTLLLSYCLEVRFASQQKPDNKDLARRTCWRFGIVSAVGLLSATSPYFKISVVPILFATLLPGPIFLDRLTTWGQTLFQYTPLSRYFRAEIAKDTTTRPQSISVTAFAVACVGIILSLYAWALAWTPSFRWAIFEERDFLLAKDFRGALNQIGLGPELLAGGQTPGGGLYALLAPIAQYWNDPVAFSIFNKILFFASPFPLFFVLHRFFGLLPALFTILLFCASQNMLGLAYWPIHPSMSIFFCCLFYSLCLFGWAAQIPLAMIFASATLSFLVQMHFSYYLLFAPFILLLFLWDKVSRRYVLTSSIFCFIFSLIPYLSYEIQTGFANSRMILTQPRFHPLYVPAAPLTGKILPVMASWLNGTWGLANQHMSWLLALLFIIASGLVVHLSLNFERNVCQSSRSRFAFALIILGLFPPLFLLLTGTGYDVRHTISFAPAIFITFGAGIGVLLLNRHRIVETCIWLTGVFFVALWVIALSNAPQMRTWTGSAGEWAVDYGKRNDVCKALIETVGISPDTYREKVFWWWVGWSMAPELYSELAGSIGKAKAPMLAEDAYCLVVTTKDTPRFIDRFFHIEDTIHLDGSGARGLVGRPRSSRGLIRPSGNSVNTCRLNPLQRQLENIRISEDGLFSVGLLDTHLPNSAKGYLLSLNKGRIKALIITQLDLAGHNWRCTLHSASLGGYYQEIKTLWQPAFVFADETGHEIQRTVLVDGVLGSLLFKAPFSAEVFLPRDKAGARPGFAISGHFDQSNMAEPQLGGQVWLFDQARPLDLQISGDGIL